MSTKPKRALGDGAAGDIENPAAKSSTFQPGLVESPEKPGATPEEQATAELKAAEKENKNA